MIIMDILSIERVWEDTDLFEIEIIAQSDLICAKVRNYITSTSINELALHLATFPKNLTDQYIWENGTRGDDSTPFLSLEFWCEDKLGHIVIEVYMELDDGASYSKHNCCFFIRTEISLLNRFGKSLISLSQSGIGKRRLLHILGNTGDYRGPADNVIFDMTGNVYDPVTKEWLGSLTQGGAKTIK
jgi:hypothetical protein